MDEKRISWIDATKGFAIFLVAVGHLKPWIGLERYIYSFHMCLFFFISGYLFKNPVSIKKYIEKKAQGLVIPFLTWNIMSSIGAWIAKISVSEMVAHFFMLHGHTCLNATLWFLPILFFVETIYAFITKFNNSEKMSVALILVCAILWIIWCLCGAENMMMRINLIPFGLMFFSMGDLAKRTSIKQLHSMKLWLTGGVLFVVSVVFGAVLNTRISYLQGDFGNIYYCIIAAISGTLFYFLLFKNWRALGKSKILCLMGRHSMIIMCTQLVLFKAYDMISMRIWEVSVYHTAGTLKAFLVAAFTILIVILCAEFYRRLFKNNPRMTKIGTYFGIR